MKTLQFDSRRVTRVLESGTFANLRLAHAWIESGIASLARLYRADGAEVHMAQDGRSFVTEGGDEAEGQADWVTGDRDSPVYAEIRGRDF